eukprot:COSAG02_NODE_18865_length_913_cov_1.221130_2_plen_117_part_01
MATDGRVIRPLSLSASLSLSLCLSLSLSLSISPTVALLFSLPTGSKETPEKQKWIRREFMPENKIAELVKKFKGTFSKEEIKDHWTTWVLQGKSWKNMEGPVCHYVCSRCHVSTSST